MPNQTTTTAFPKSMSFTTEAEATEWVQSNLLITFPYKGAKTLFCFGDNNSELSKNMHAYLLTNKQRTLVLKLGDEREEAKYKDITNELLYDIKERKHYIVLKHPTNKQIEDIIYTLKTDKLNKPTMIIANYSAEVVELSHIINEAKEDTGVYLIILAQSNQNTSNLHSDALELSIEGKCSKLGLIGDKEYEIYFPITKEESVCFDSMVNHP